MRAKKGNEMGFEERTRKRGAIPQRCGKEMYRTFRRPSAEQVLAFCAAKRGPLRGGRVVETLVAARLHGRRDGQRVLERILLIREGEKKTPYEFTGLNTTPG